MSEPTINVLYFAWVREAIGAEEETVPLPAEIKTAGDLVAHLLARGGGYGDALRARDKLRIAVNQVHAGFEHPVKAGDEVAIFPPVTGG